MIYEAIVLGATFTAAGIAAVMGKDCLLIERRPQAGYEFLNAIHFGYDYNKPLQTKEAEQLFDDFRHKGAFCDGRVCLFDCAGLFYQTLEDKNVLLNMELLSVTRKEDLFEVTAHGVSGYRTFFAKKIIDTRVSNGIIQEKTLNLLVKNLDDDKATLPGSAEEQWGRAGDVLVKIPLEASEDYIVARKKVKAFLKNMPSGFKVVCVADCFACKVVPDYPKLCDGISFLPSAAFQNPLLAFDRGVLFARGGAI